MFSRCPLPRCPCDSTSPPDALVIDVEPTTALKARHAVVEILVYQCAWDDEHSPCGMFIEGTPRDIFSHLRQHHGLFHNVKDALECRWSSCSIDGPLKMGSIARHILRHLGIQFRCSRCELVMARDDVVRDHIRRLPGCADAEVQLVPGSGARWIVSASTLQSRGEPKPIEVEIVYTSTDLDADKFFPTPPSRPNIWACWQALFVTDLGEISTAESLSSVTVSRGNFARERATVTTASCIMYPFYFAQELGRDDYDLTYDYLERGWAASCVVYAYPRMDNGDRLVLFYLMIM
ncbi:hypothetical protein DFH29DRAFT_872860 [Suillus ampliporus]|nr:hypothetical protein DFH29DRAFT_872860 [Suillus ampliporus]